MLEFDEMTDTLDPDSAPGQASGNWNPSWEPFAALDPAWTEKAVALAIAPAVSGARCKPGQARRKSPRCCSSPACRACRACGSEPRS